MKFKEVLVTILIGLAIVGLVLVLGWRMDHCTNELQKAGEISEKRDIAECLSGCSVIPNEDVRNKCYDLCEDK